MWPIYYEFHETVFVSILCVYAFVWLVFFSVHSSTSCVFALCAFINNSQENDSNKVDATEKGSAEYDTEKEAADSGEKDSDSNNLSNHSSPNKSAQIMNEIMAKEELKLATDNEKDSDKQSDNEEGSKQSIKPYVQIAAFYCTEFQLKSVTCHLACGRMSYTVIELDFYSYWFSLLHC